MNIFLQSNNNANYCIAEYLIVGYIKSVFLYHFPKTANLPRAGIIHRLDKDTTGLLVVAHSLKAHTHLIRQLQERTMGREYLALVLGEPTAGGTVNLAIGRHPKLLKMAIRPDGREAITHYRIEEGEHVIPAPLGQLRRDFAGYFMDPIKQFIHKARGNAVDVDEDQKATEDGPNDRTVVRPTFSYFGSFTISEQVIRDIIKIAAEEYESHLVVVDRMNNGKQTNMSVTIDVMAVRDPESIDKCMDLQQDVYGALVNMTAFTIDSVNVRIRDIVRDREEMLSRKLH